MAICLAQYFFSSPILPHLIAVWEIIFADKVKLVLVTRKEMFCERNCTKRAVFRYSSYTVGHPFVLVQKKNVSLRSNSLSSIFLTLGSANTLRIDLLPLFMTGP